MVSIIYVEHNAIHNNDFVFETDGDQDYWLVLLTHTPALFFVGGQMKEYPANCAVIFPPKHKILYRACTDTYANDWLRFHAEKPFFPEPNQPPLGIPFMVPDSVYLHDMFILLASENFFDHDYKALNIYHLFQLLINKLLEASKHANIFPYYHAIIELRKKIYNNPKYNWTLSEISKELNISISYVNRLYKSIFGISCIDDVIHGRITLAKEHLIRSSYSVSEIANLCGYNNAEHFYRQFRKITGYTPLVFRSKYKK